MNPMFYEMQFRSEKKDRYERTKLVSDYSSSLDNHSDAAIVFDDSQNCLFLNSAAEAILGEDRELLSLIGDWISSKMHGTVEHSNTFSINELPEKIAAICQAKLDSLEVLVSRLDISDEFWQELSDRNLFNSIEFIEDLDPSLTVETTTVDSAIVLDSNQDSLTGLPNYNLLFAYIEQEICFARQQLDYQFTVLFIDINRFKVINSSLGRILGDRLLVAVSERLQACLRAQDFIARMGNDEFAILLNPQDD